MSNDAPEHRGTATNALYTGDDGSWQFKNRRPDGGVLSVGYQNGTYSWSDTAGPADANGSGGALPLDISRKLEGHVPAKLLAGPGQARPGRPGAAAPDRPSGPKPWGTLKPLAFTAPTVNSSGRAYRRRVVAYAAGPAVAVITAVAAAPTLPTTAIAAATAGATAAMAGSKLLWARRSRYVGGLGADTANEAYRFVKDAAATLGHGALADTLDELARDMWATIQDAARAGTFNDEQLTSFAQAHDAARRLVARHANPSESGPGSLRLRDSVARAEALATSLDQLDHTN